MSVLTKLWQGGSPSRAPFVSRRHDCPAAARIELEDPDIVLGYAHDGNTDERYITMTVQRDGVQVEFRVDPGALAERLNRADEWQRTGIEEL